MRELQIQRIHVIEDEQETGCRCANDAGLSIFDICDWQDKASNGG